MWKYVATVSYTGTNYCGWQKQKLASEAVPSPSGLLPSIQGTITDALKQMTSEEAPSVVGSGRTDSGVHALGQPAHFVLKKKPWECEILKRGLNGLLPRDIRILNVREVPIEFHAQRSAVKKQYSYYFQQGPCALPALDAFSWWISRALDVGAMSRALSRFSRS